MRPPARSVLELDFPDVERFRTTVRSWLEANLTGDYRDLAGRTDLSEQQSFAIRLAWERELGAANFVGLAWPERYGGRACSLAEQAVFEQEYARSGAPERMGGFGEHMLGPLLMARGTEEQRARFLPGVLRGTEIWCQGYSEPNAGSDLAAVSCRATDRGDHWSVTGSKVWTSFAHHADWIMLVTRTGTPESRHKGLTFLLAPMDQPGIEVRPLRDMSGGRHFNEVFFEDARTGKDCVVGDAGDGWSVANTLLTFERGTSVLGVVWKLEAQFEAVLARARADGLTSEPRVRDALAEAWMRLRLIGLNAEAVLRRSMAGGTPGVESSMTKVLWSEWHQDFTDLAATLQGLDGLVRPSSAVHEYATDPLQHELLFSRAETIYAGSSQIQRNLLSERVLGLPRG